jgi:parallel beta-helix repeat protein/predicted outer membrane repeat protein
MTMALANSASATIRYVDNAALPGGNGLSWGAAFGTVQAGIDVAVSGDEVWVRQGTYYENIVMKDGVALLGGFAGSETSKSQRNWVLNKTILDGGKLGSVLRIENCPSPSTTVSGLTIRNGSGTINPNWYSQLCGGGVYISGSSPVIENNTIVENRIDGGSGYGGGIYCGNSSFPNIRNNIIDNNVASSCGGGISVINYSTPTITNNEIAGNSAGLSGGAVYGFEYSYIRIIGNRLIGNVASGTSGGAIYTGDASPAQIDNNVISGNVTGGAGGPFI